MGIISVEQCLVTSWAALERARGELNLPIPDDGLAIAFGQVMGESKAGRSVQGDAPAHPGGGFPWATCNNGNVQAVKAWCLAKAKLGAGWGYMLLGDVHSDGTPYVFPYRLCPTPLDGAKDYLEFLFDMGPMGANLARGPAKISEMRSAEAWAIEMKTHGYYEAPIAEYIKMIQSWLPRIAAMRAGAPAFDGISPEDVTVRTGDDLPPNAQDGQHLPGRVTAWGAASPPSGAFTSGITDTGDLYEDEIASSP